MADKNKLIHDLAAAASMTPDEFIAVVKQRCFKDGAASDAQLILLLTIAKKYDLNPLAREVHAFINEKRGNAMEISIGLDGWIKIATRHVQFNGYEATPILNEQGVLTGIDMRMHRKDWAYPGVYTAWMDEWLVAGKQGAKSNWEQYPRHRLFGKAFQECARFTFGITEVVDEDDVVRIERATAAEDVIHQSGPAEPKALEHTPAIPMTDFRNGAQEGEKVPVQSLRVVPDAQQAVTLPACQHAGCASESRGGPYKTKAGEFYLCDEHRAEHEVKPRGRPRKVDVEAVKVEAEVVESGGGQAGVIPPSPAPVAAVVERGPCSICGKSISDTTAPDGHVTSEYRGARGECLDCSKKKKPVPQSDDETLESFIAAHNVSQKRIDLALAKYGAAAIGELTPEQQTATFHVFRKSYEGAK